MNAQYVQRANETRRNKPEAAATVSDPAAGQKNAIKPPVRCYPSILINYALQGKKGCHLGGPQLQRLNESHTFTSSFPDDDKDDILPQMCLMLRACAGCMLEPM